GLRAERGLLLCMIGGGVVLALGPTIDLPDGLGRVRGPQALLLAVPGYDALRAPGRFVHVTLLGASVLAAGGAAALLAGLPRRAAAPVALVLLVRGAGECRT